jgi:(4-O-methyl)-D-glucuronate---lignin esterase
MMPVRSRVLFGLLLLPALVLSAAQAGWLANPQTVRETAAKQPGFNYEESRVAPYTLPDPLVAGGTRVRTAEAWRSRRTEILDLFRANVYGRSPGRPEHLGFHIVEQPRAMDGAATLKRITILSTQAGVEHRFEVILFLPNAKQGPSPVFLLLNNRPVSNTDPTRRELSDFWPAEQVIARGYGIAAIQNNELAPDDKDRYREGVMRLFENGTEARPDNPWAALGAWAWGASRAMDYFATDPRVDVKHVAVVGHSRGGKAALWAGAEDERFALVVSNESGEGGAALTRRDFAKRWRESPRRFRTGSPPNTRPSRTALPRCRSISTCCSRSSLHERSTWPAPTKTCGPIREASSCPRCTRRRYSPSGAIVRLPPRTCRR